MLRNKPFQLPYVSKKVPEMIDYINRLGKKSKVWLITTTLKPKTNIAITKKKHNKDNKKVYSKPKKTEALIQDHCQQQPKLIKRIKSSKTSHRLIVTRLNKKVKHLNRDVETWPVNNSQEIETNIKIVEE